MVKRWYADFKHGHTDTNDTEPSGRPSSAVFPENTKKLNKLLFSDCKLKSRKIAVVLKISQSSVFFIFQEHLLTRKLWSKWLPRLLSVDQKQQRIDNSERCLQQFQRKKKNEFLHKYGKMNEIWDHQFTPDSNRWSAEWTAEGENRPKKPKTQTSAVNVWASVF